MSENEEESVELNTDLKETIKEIENDITATVLDKTIEKPKKPRSEAQKNALRKAQETRRINALKKKEMNEEYMEDSEYFKRLTPQQRKLLKDMAVEKEVKVVPSKPRVKAIYESDPSTDEEVVIVKKKKPNKKKKKQKIIYQSASESSEEDEPIVKEIQRKKKKVEIVESSSEEETYEYEYQHKQPLTYSGVARFL